WVFGGDRGAIGERHAEGFDGAGHGVGGVHAAAGTGAGNAAEDDFGAFLVADFSGDEFAVGLKGGDDVELGMAGRAAGANGAAIDHDGRPVEAAHGYQAAGHVFVATGKGDQAVVPLGTHDGFDRIGDKVAGLERIAHALGAHADAVGDADGVE